MWIATTYMRSYDTNCAASKSEGFSFGLAHATVGLESFRTAGPTPGRASLHEGVAQEQKINSQTLPAYLAFR